MSWMLGDERILKADGETFHQKGQKVWLLKNWTVTVKPQRGQKCLGIVSKDSVWPDMWTTLDLWDKSQAADYWNRNNPAWVKAASKKATAAYLTRKKVARGPRV